MEPSATFFDYSAARTAGLIELPTELAACAARHQKHLGDLIISFRSLGMDEDTIGRHVHQLVSSYEAELLSAIQEVMKEPFSA
jgi:hypothetical protein